MKSDSRVQWKLRAACAAILVSAVLTCLFVGMRPQRKEFVGNVDPVSGYRCRFTLSPVWQWHVKTGLTGNRQGNPSSYGNHGDFNPGDSSVDSARFTFPPPDPPDPLSQWLSLHFFPKAKPGKPPGIGLLSCTPKDFPADLRLVRGYPDPVWEETAPKHTQSHLLIDGCPATLIYSTLLQDSPGRAVYLFVYKPDSELLYTIGGVADEANSAWLHREMQAIVASFHIEKVPVGKR